MYGVFVHYTANTDIYTDLHSLSLHDALPTYGRQRFNGELVGIDGDVVLISDKEGVEHRLPFDAIDTAKLVLTDKLIAATVPLSIEGADEMEEEGQDCWQLPFPLIAPNSWRLTIRSTERR